MFIHSLAECMFYRDSVCFLLLELRYKDIYIYTTNLATNVAFRSPLGRVAHTISTFLRVSASNLGFDIR